MPEPTTGSVTFWIGELQEGREGAIGKLWERYFRDLVQVAAGQLRGVARGVADEEDVALSVLHTVCRRAAAGRLPPLDDRNDLWRVLMILVKQKSIDHRRSETRQKRGGGMVVHETAERSGENSESESSLDYLLGDAPSPDDVASMREELGKLLGSLPDTTLRAVAVGKLDGSTNEEIARQLDVTCRTVERKLQLIRTIWLQQLGDPCGAAT